jgi:beta-lactamase superfamily II metal-dependent hydrolase
MGFEIDFLPVGDGQKSGDAIAFRIGNLNGLRNEQFVCVVDGGYSDDGAALVNHIKTYFKTDAVDLVISSHPDDDHALGLLSVVEALKVGALWMHLPWDHTQDIARMFKDGRVTDMSVREKIRKSLDAAMDLERAAKKRGIPIIEPFTGTAMADRVFVIGPTQQYYESVLADFRCTPVARAQPVLAGSLIRSLVEGVKNVAEDWNIETLSDKCETAAENNSSTVLAVKASETAWWLLTADAGEPALNGALDYLDSRNFPVSNFTFVQVPHHGSEHNVGPTLLNRMLGPKLPNEQRTRTAYVSAAKEAPKHPNKKVTNAFRRRGAPVYRTNGAWISHFQEAPVRNYANIDPLPLYTEIAED